MVETYIAKIDVDLWQQRITLDWTGECAAEQPRGPYRCSPGAGLTGINCDRTEISRTPDTNCTPKGDWPVISYLRYFEAHPEARWVTLFQSLERGVGLHYYPFVPPYPDSHGCVRVADEAVARQIYDHTHPQESIVSVHGELRPPYGIVLKAGDRGENVRKLQRQLSEQGYNLLVDGDFGPNTQTALMQFQRDASLAVDGVFGSSTYEALFT